MVRWGWLLSWPTTIAALLIFNKRLLGKNKNKCLKADTVGDWRHPQRAPALLPATRQERTQHAAILGLMRLKRLSVAWFKLGAYLAAVAVRMVCRAAFIQLEQT